MTTEHEAATRYNRVVNRLAKWRVFLTGWQLGTRAKGDPEGDAVRDHRELSLMLRVEVTAITKLMIDKRICTPAELTEAITDEAEYYEKTLEQRFPGVRAEDYGLVFGPEAHETMRHFKP